MRTGVSRGIFEMWNYVLLSSPDLVSALFHLHVSVGYVDNLMILRVVLFLTVVPPKSRFI